MSILFPSELPHTQEKPPVATLPVEEQPAEAEVTQAAEADKPAEEHAAHAHFHPGKHRDHAVAHPAPSGVSHLDAGSVIFR
jgi:hypothetical protein